MREDRGVSPGTATAGERGSVGKHPREGKLQPRQPETSNNGMKVSAEEGAVQRDSDT